jgi:flavin reductase (DIM6/NTAB) family NADH-FMN oxidoreductase RutF
VHATSNSQKGTADLFRRAMRGVAATVTVITTVGSDGRRYGLTATAFSPVSMDPPTLLACINTNASLHKALLESRRLCVNVLTTANNHLVGPFSGMLKGEDRFTVGEWSANEDGLPYFPEAQSNFFCRVDQLILVATHTIAVARVTDVRSSETTDPLLYLNGHCASATRLVG